ncbi:MAG: hypothetical protein OXH59_02425 [Rhodospirillaceae bacterium]|nr:hypothetical protein [Rhodospirillaceae bacterium]
MKFRNREFNIFSMSALDLFASAMGAFILISIVLMPYFLRTDPKEVERLRQNLAQAQASAAQAQAAQAQARANLQQCRQREAACRRELESQRQGAATLQRCQADLQACKIKLSKTFLAFVIQWPTNRHDVDLHVIDPAGREFYYRRKRIPGRPGELSADTQRGPGVEIWEVTVAPVGTYRVLYNLYSRHGNPAPAVVKGGVYHRDGHHRFRQRRLTAVGRRSARLVAVVTVRSGGNVEISER